MDDPDAGPRRTEALLAVRNAAQMLGSLILGWGIGLGMRVWIPRHLGPERFGELNFADALTATAFIALNLGVDVYIRTEVAVRKERASDFFAGLWIVRLGLTALLGAGLVAGMHWTHRSPEMQQVVALFAVGQFLINTNGALSALLQARGNVAEMSVLSVASKILWGAAIAAAILLGAGLWAFAVALVVSEGLEGLVLFALARRYLGLRWRWRSLAATKALLVFGFPFYVKFVAQTAYQRLDVSLLAVMAGAREVGWYGAASTLGGIGMLTAPLITWVLTPMGARALARSESDLHAMSRRWMELILAIAVPTALVLGLGAELWVRLLFGAPFLPAAHALQIGAGLLIVTYVNIVCSLILTLLNRGWTLTVLAAVGLAVNLTSNLFWIPRCLAWVGPGGGGVGCALSMLSAEVVMTAAMVVLVGRRTFDARALRAVGKTLVAAGLVVLLDRFLAAWGPARLLADAVAYLALVAVSGAVPVQELLELVRPLWRRGPAPSGVL